MARCLSLAGHPFFVIPLTVAFATRSWRSAAVIAATTTLPLTLIIARKVRRGTWSDADVSRRDQRFGLYFLMIPLLVLTGLVLHLTGTGPGLMRGVIAGAILLAAGLLANMMFDAYCAVIIFSILPRAAPLLAIFVAAVAWSRHKLDRHTVPEILTGIVLGLATGWWAAFW
jgi:hypothetical protein